MVAPNLLTLGQMTLEHSIVAVESGRESGGGGENQGRGTSKLLKATKHAKRM